MVLMMVARLVLSWAQMMVVKLAGMSVALMGMRLVAYLAKL